MKLKTKLLQEVEYRTRPWYVEEKCDICGLRFNNLFDSYHTYVTNYDIIVQSCLVHGVCNGQLAMDCFTGDMVVLKRNSTIRNTLRFLANYFWELAISISSGRISYPFLDFMWKVVPERLGHILRQRTGYVWSRTERNGKSIRYYIRKYSSD